MNSEEWGCIPKPETGCQCLRLNGGCCISGLGPECPVNMTQEDLLCDDCRDAQKEKRWHCHIIGPQMRRIYRRNYYANLDKHTARHTMEMEYTSRIGELEDFKETFRLRKLDDTDG
jgi:hypothetical protein